MNKYKYKHKSISKSWKKKKSAIETVLTKRKIEKPEQKQKAKIPFKSNKRKALIFSNTSSSRWKLPGFLFLAGLIIVILVIPTLIVVPYINKGDQDSITVKEKESLPQVLDSPFSVSVMRSQSEQIENVPLETYVTRVVASEMPAEFEEEALKAQTLAARTYIVNLLLQNGEEDATVTDTVQHQVYKNEDELRKIWGTDFNWKMEKVKTAVAETQGEILTYEDSPITPAFFSTSNGFTENSEDYWENELPYLRSVKSPWDKDSPKFLDQKVMTINEVEQALGIDIPNAQNLTAEITRTESNRVDQLKIAGKTFTGREIREKLDLKSSDFTIEKNKEHLIFQTKGYGHGIGMSQYGANGMAMEGKNYQEIVKYYYNGVNISPVTETAPTLVAK